MKPRSKDTSPPVPSVIEGLRLQGTLADRLLSEKGVILTQGGEPTFVPENTDSPEWNLAALGEEKLSFAWALCRELVVELLPGAVILKSNGKHYPGEPIPRWKLTLLRRTSGEPLWHEGKLLDQGDPAHPKNKGSKPVTPRKFLSELSSELGLPHGLCPVYEDVEVLMRDAALRGESPPLPRYSRTRKGFVQPRWSVTERKKWGALHRAAGWVLPLDRVGGGWVTDDWSPPGGADLLLLPGTSSIGLRLPLHRLPSGALQRAMTAEATDGQLRLFLPPLPDAESFADLLQAIEKTASSLGSQPILLEGYPPPEEEGWESLSVIPDPGVIEVNLPPAASWESLENVVSGLFKAASRAGLNGARRLPGGEVVATGGGGHLVLGGPSLEKNPFLLHPGLLPSFLRFIQRHPVLSYLFSGRFVGPSSQAPRIDETLFEVPKELGVALTALESQPSPCNPGMVDAILRNLLLDLHGNTHKAEVSIDKFFNPHMPNGRLGLVEFRAIEMSPEAPMFLAVHALWRALAASFIIRPFTGPLIDWKEQLNDRHRIPSLMEKDLGEVLRYLSDFGFSFDQEWFSPQFLFRFPVVAEGTSGKFRWSLRRAVEPWPLLGEQPTLSGGLVRCVDSSTERLEFRIHGETLEEGDQPLIRVNGWEMPLAPHPGGGFFGTVRFRTILLPTCLHPQVMPHTPLEFTISDHGDLDVWHYHAHPVENSGTPLRVTHAGKAGLYPDRESDRTTVTGLTLDLLALS